MDNIVSPPPLLPLPLQTKCWHRRDLKRKRVISKLLSGLRWNLRRMFRKARQGLGVKSVLKLARNSEKITLEFGTDTNLRILGFHRQNRDHKKCSKQYKTGTKHTGSVVNEALKTPQAWLLNDLWGEGRRYGFPMLPGNSSQSKSSPSIESTTSCYWKCAHDLNVTQNTDRSI